jgi:hypothetical protein
MFEHLVESGSHSEDLKRKGSFLAGFDNSLSGLDIYRHDLRES